MPVLPSGVDHQRCQTSPGIRFFLWTLQRWHANETLWLVTSSARYTFRVWQTRADPERQIYCRYIRRVTSRITETSYRLWQTNIRLDCIVATRRITRHVFHIVYAESCVAAVSQSISVLLMFSIFNRFCYFWSCCTNTTKQLKVRYADFRKKIIYISTVWVETIAP